MSRFLKPERFGVEPNTTGSDLKWMHWRSTFDNFLSEEITTTTNECMKLKLLINHLSPSVYSIIQEVENYKSAIETLENAYIKPKNNSHSHHLSATKKQLEESILEKKDIFPNKRICRVCTQTADIPISNKISDKTGSVLIITALRMVTNISISETDKYPKYVCKVCLHELNIALNFKKKCETSDKTFRQMSIKTNNVVFHDLPLIIVEPMGEKKSNEPRISNNILEPDVEIIEDETPNHIRNLEKLNKTSKHKCEKCNQSFSRKKSLTEHFKHKCGFHACPLCGKLVLHLKEHHKLIHERTKKFTCHICGKIYYSASSLGNHLYVHKEKEFSCALCPYKCKRKAYLTLHMRGHTGERSYLCSECPLSFVDQSNLRKHQLTHSIETYECIKCKKHFRSQKSLKEHHDAAHLNVRYRCTICGKDLWTRRKLLSHELRVHKREKHKLFEDIQMVVVNDQND